MDHGAFADYTALLTTEPFTPAFASGVSEEDMMDVHVEEVLAERPNVYLGLHS